MQTFPSKVDGRIWMPLAILLLSVTILLVLLQVWPGVALLFFANAFVASIFFNTAYSITQEGQLIIRCGVLMKKEIEIRSIKKVIHTTSPLASPALSTKRLKIAYNKWDKIMISPQNEDVFLATLKQKNPSIEIK